MKPNSKTINNILSKSEKSLCDFKIIIDYILMNQYKIDSIIIDLTEKGFYGVKDILNSFEGYGHVITKEMTDGYEKIFWTYRFILKSMVHYENPIDVALNKYFQIVHKVTENDNLQKEIYAYIEICCNKRNDVYKDNNYDDWAEITKNEGYTEYLDESN